MKTNSTPLFQFLTSLIGVSAAECHTLKERARADRSLRQHMMQVD